MDIRGIMNTVSYRGKHETPIKPGDALEVLNIEEGKVRGITT